MVNLSYGAIPSSLRRTNERNLIGLLMRLGSASRAELAKAAGVSPPTAGKITNDLLATGVLEELDAPETAQSDERPRLGRPGRLLRLNTTTARFLAIELDVGETRMAALPLAAPAEDNWAVAFDTPDKPSDWQRQIKSAARKLPCDALWGVLVSVPGIVDENAGKVLYSPNLHWTEKADLPALLGQLWNVPILLVQEIRALALGLMAANPKETNFLLVDFGQGVGGAIIEGGRLFSNPLPLNGEVGHAPVLGNNRRCGCGATGCLETLVSRNGLLRSFAEANPHGPRSWAALCEHVERYGIPKWLEAALESAGAVIANALNVLGLRRLVITGCITELPPIVTVRLAEFVKAGALWARFGEVHVSIAKRHRAAGLVAAGIDRLLVPAPHYHHGQQAAARRQWGKRFIPGIPTQPS